MYNDRNEKIKEDANALVKDSTDSAVEYINNITEKVQNYTADKLEKFEKKTLEVLDDTKATTENTARTINNLVDKKSGDLKNAVDRLLFK